MHTTQEKMDRLAEAVQAMARYAVEHQTALETAIKADGSPVTQVDRSISATLVALLERLFPSCAVITEEEDVPFKEDAPCTFVLDPVDGTDVYTEGFPSWCVSLGILDARHRPIGAMIAAPRFGMASDGLFVRLDPGRPLLVDGIPFRPEPKTAPVIQTMAGSDTIKRMTVERIPGKVRCFGSTVLHLLAPVLVPKVTGAVQSTGFIWDYAGAHAVLRACGMDLYDESGRTLAYDGNALHKGKIGTAVFAGSLRTVEELRKLVAWR